MDAIPPGSLIYALKAADKGWPASMPLADAEVVGAAAFHGYLDHDGQVTDKGRRLLKKVGFLVPEVA
jgi:hypothetical protein